MAQNRRTVLGMMGLASAIAPMSAEAASRDLSGSKSCPTFGIDKDKLAAALHRLADDIGAGRTYVNSFKMQSQSTFEEFLEHEIAIKFQFDESVPNG